MKKPIFFLCATVIFVSCTSVPQVKNSWTQKEDKYDVSIDRDYLDDSEEFKYAINSFVKDRGGTSYNIEKHGPNDFYIWIPGDTPVEDLPMVKHFHAGRTVSAILPPSIGVALITIIILSFL